VSPPRIPRATYRLQLHAGFTFADTEALVPYLSDLGISHLYLSPFFKARPGSTHGYDIIDHNALNPEIGDEAALDRLVATLDRHSMGILLDFVPNHVGIGNDNMWWMDVLEWGRDSSYSDYFDINWRPTRRDLHGKVLVPILADHYGGVLEGGDIAVRFDAEDGTFNAWYHQYRLPIFPGHYGRILRPVASALAGSPAADMVAAAIGASRDIRGLRSRKERVARADQLKSALASLAGQPAFGAALADALDRLNGRPGEPRSFAGLHRLLEAQYFRVAYWRVAGNEVNYRRFFEINDLAGLRMEAPDVFAATHRLVLRLLSEGKVHGLRIDHVDGLFHPAQYCQRLQAKAGELPGRREEVQPVYLLVEKILASHERLRRDWRVAGTTGYEFMNQVNGLFVDGDNGDLMETIYRRFSGYGVPFESDIHQAKLAVMRVAMASELGVLTGELAGIARSHWTSRDFTVSGLRDALREVVSHFPVYRTYVTARRVTDQDRRYIGWAIAQARKAAAGDASVYDFLQSVLDTSLIRRRAPFYKRREVVGFAMHFQQYTSPVMAKGYEDTALYRYNRLIALNEVGGNPRRFGISISAFHQDNRRRLRSHPHGMLATATHDSKRGEDVRVRIDVLSEMPEEWRRHLDRWARLNQGFKQATESGEAPDRNDEIFIYQTLIGAWPADAEGGAVADFVDRLGRASVKAVREAKRISSWTAPNPAYEAGLLDFLHRITETGRHNPFLDDFTKLQRRVARIGRINGLSQTLLKLTVPGVPDIYQGAELWQLDLVDPDNRRPVEYGLRRMLLARGEHEALPDLLDRPEDGAVKLGLIRVVLAFRRRFPALFTLGGYQPLAVRGDRGGHICAFCRRHEGQLIVVAVPVLLGRLWGDAEAMPPPGRAWRDTLVELPRDLGQARLTNVLTGAEMRPDSRRGGSVLAAEALFAAFPLALLHGRAEGHSNG